MPCATLITHHIWSCPSFPFSDLVKVRFQADATGTRYRSTWHAFESIWRHEGIQGFYKGATATTSRAMLVTGTQLATYDSFKHYMLNHGLMEEGVGLQLVASFIAGGSRGHRAHPGVTRSLTHYHGISQDAHLSLSFTRAWMCYHHLTCGSGQNTHHEPAFMCCREGCSLPRCHRLVGKLALPIESSRPFALLCQSKTVVRPLAFLALSLRIAAS